MRYGKQKGFAFQQNRTNLSHLNLYKNLFRKLLIQIIKKEKLVVTDDTLLTLFSNKLEKANSALYRNWSFQSILVMISIFYIFGNKESVTSQATRFAGFNINENVLISILALLLLYKFIKFGFIVGQFLIVHDECNNIAKKLKKSVHLKNTYSLFSGIDLEMIFETTNFFEPASNADFYKKRNPFILPLMYIFSVLIVSLNHTSVFILNHIVFSNSSRTAGFIDVFVLSILVGFYWQMLSSPAKKFRIIRIASIVVLICVVSFFVLWWIFLKHTI